jgi:hypothetical protein
MRWLTVIGNGLGGIYTLASGIEAILGTNPSSEYESYRLAPASGLRPLRRLLDRLRS